MIILLPAGILLMVYFFFFARPAVKELVEIKRQVTLAEKRAPSQAKQAATFSELRSLESMVNAKKGADSERSERGSSILAAWDDPDARAMSGSFIGELLADSGVILVEEAIAEEKDRKEFAEILAPIPSAELWRLRLAGNYNAMRRTLAVIGQTDLPIIPVGIEMEPMAPGNKSVHIWRLWICR
ncbi:MAG: hypothetical protein AAGI48_03470 [Verrucomicrobiota bacterium]